MAKIKLSKRLQAVADFVPKGARLADIGSDHAKLPLALLAEQQISFAIVGEVAKGPYEISQEHTKTYPEIVARLADGLDAIEAADKIDTVTIAGMGGILISEILARGKEKLKNVDCLILQPNREEYMVRQWSWRNGFQITTERIIEDSHKIYEVIVAKHGEQILTQEQEKFGLFLVNEPIFRKKWQAKLAKLDKVMSFLPEDKVAERQALLNEKAEIEGVLKS